MPTQQPDNSTTTKLTQYSHGAGCGCKIAPALLDQILVQATEQQHFPQLLVGNEARDDAAVVDLGDGTAIISTTDFFMPIVDDAFDFGQIAAVNAISDIYAMGGQPLLAIAILGWPIDKISTTVANQVIEGGRVACAKAGIPLAGGHSIDSPEPIFGLAVTGRVPVANLKRNGGAQAGDVLFLTKPLGVGILSTAQKKGKLRPEDATLARDTMVQLNRIGTELGTTPYVHAMTDVTGFGLLGHLNEMTAASGLSAELYFDQVPLLDRDKLQDYLEAGCIPGGTHRNWSSYSQYVGPLTDHQRYLLADPQTSGGLLVAVSPESTDHFLAISKEHALSLQAIGRMVEAADKRVYIVV